MRRDGTKEFKLRMNVCIETKESAIFLRSTNGVEK